MTRSALASAFGEMVKPICFAVFRLITNSNFVGCSTGKSAVDKFGNGLLEHLKPLSPWFPGKGCNASDIAVRTTERSRPGLPRQDRSLLINDGDGFGCILGRLDPRRPLIRP